MEQWRKVSQTHDEGGLRKALLESMFWLKPKDSAIKLLVDSETVEAEVLAALPGAAFVQIVDESGKGPSWHKKVDRQVAKRFPERILVFRGLKEDSWYWPKKLSSGTVSYERLLAKPFSLPDYLAQRLAGLSFEASDHENPATMNPTSVREKIRGQFQSAQITENFYKTFKKKHEMLSSKISGLSDENASSSYATVLLNRLMFVYFLQKKEFLNGDPNYLRTCLDQLQRARGENKFYSFYKDYLLEFFFNKLDKSGGVLSDPFLEEIAGDIPYINGGVFGETNVEKENEIEIPDEAFEEIFNFFDSYTWHLDTRPTGNSNEINPEVIGFIFEQYINFTASGKKENGAYYTKPDVTGYMVAQTLLPRIVRELIDLGLNVFDLIKQNPSRYIHDSRLRGYDSDSMSWTPAPEELQSCWEGDPIGWHLLDESEHDEEFCLPGETWVEMFDRREKVDALVKDCNEGLVDNVDDLVTRNLDTQSLLSDSISLIEEQGQAEELWNRVSKISVLDPTCGSGAFLFTAMELLEDIYAAILDKLEELDNKSKVLEQAETHPNRRYFLRKHIALRNLYGTDIMDDAIETAKLRIFLSLASCLESKSQLEPLPDLDFNLKVGNLVAGFVDSSDVDRVSNGRLIVENRLANLEGSLDEHIDIYERFREVSESNGDMVSHVKGHYVESEKKLRKIANEYYAECTNKSEDEYVSWADEVKPFHWSIEFPEVMSRGGFDVIVGNPPYVSRSEIPTSTKEALVGFKCSALPDFYAVCLERTQSLLSHLGKRAMIVMLSFSFSSRYEPLRSLYFNNDHSRTVWISTYGKRPDSLFRGVEVVNTIVIDHSAEENSSWVTSHNIFTKERRNWLFDNLLYSPTVFTEHQVPIRGGVCSGLFAKHVESAAKRGFSGRQIFLRGTSSYWFSILPVNPPLVSADFKVTSPYSPEVKSVKLWDGEAEDLTCALLASKIGYLWWSSVGDDFNSLASQTVVPRRIAASFIPSKELINLAQRVVAKGNEHWFAFRKHGSMTLNIRWTEIGYEMDSFVSLFLVEAKLEEYWRPLNVWYRKTMVSSGAGSSVYEVPDSLIANMVDTKLPRINY